MLKKIFTLYTKYFAVWIIVFGIIAYFFPKPFLAVSDFNQWFFAITMFGIGMVLRVEDFRKIVKNPLIVLIGSAAQFTLMPLGAYIAAKLFSLPDELAVGLIITGAAPGAMSSNVMSYIAKADTAYSVSLTTVSTMLCPIVTPLLILLLAGTRLPVEVGKMMADLAMMVILPLVIGITIRYHFERAVKKIEDVFPAISITFIIFICSLVIAANRDYLVRMTGILAAVGLVLNLFGMAGGYGVGKLFRMGTIRSRTLSIEIGMQNAGLGVILAKNNFGDRAAMPAAFFVFICIITASLAAEYWRRDKPSGKSGLDKQGIYNENNPQTAEYQH